MEVTTRTLQGRFLLRPSRDLNDIAVGIVHFVVLSNHMHALLVPRDAEQLALFMDYVNGNLAKEAGRLHDWRERFWGRRYRAIVVSDEPEAQKARLRYLFSQGCKEGLVRRPHDWPGASSTAALCSGEELRGWWFDRTAEFNARRHRELFSKYDHAEEQRLDLVPLPCWRKLPPEQRWARTRQMVREIEGETRERMRDQGSTPMGRKCIEAQHAHAIPASSHRSPAPRFHSATWQIRKALELAFYEFRLAYRQAAEDLRAGRRTSFPTGSFPPRLPFARGRPAPGCPEAPGTSPAGPKFVAPHRQSRARWKLAFRSLDRFNSRWRIEAPSPCTWPGLILRSPCMAS